MPALQADGPVEGNDAPNVRRIADVTIVGPALIRSIDAAPGPGQQDDAAVALARTLTGGLRRPDTLQAAA